MCSACLYNAWTCVIPHPYNDRYRSHFNARCITITDKNNSQTNGNKPDLSLNSGILFSCFYVLHMTQVTSLQQLWSHPQALCFLWVPGFDNYLTVFSRTMNRWKYERTNYTSPRPHWIIQDSNVIQQKAELCLQKAEGWGGLCRDFSSLRQERQNTTPLLVDPLWRICFPHNDQQRAPPH